MTQEQIEQRLREEISIILKKDAASLDAESSLRSNGLNSMTFIELLLAVERAWGLKLYELNLPASDTRTIRALAARISTELSRG